VLNDHDLAQQLGRAARRRVEAEFSLPKTAEQHLELFEALLVERNSFRSGTE
jgi:glycosyltransferase involved in cell wall biosynthesis